MAAWIALGLFTGSALLSGCSAPWEEEEEEGVVDSVWDDNTHSYHNYWHPSGGGYYMLGRTPYMHPDAAYQNGNPLYGKSGLMKKQDVGKKVNLHNGGLKAVTAARESGRVSYENPMQSWQQGKRFLKNVSHKSGIGGFSHRSGSIGG